MINQPKGKEMVSKRGMQKSDHHISPGNLDNYFPGNSISRAIELYEMRRELARLRRKLQASENRFQNVIDKSADGIFIINQKGIVCFVNPCAEALFNCTAQELLGKDFFGSLVVEGSACQMDTEIIPTVGEKEREERICVVTTQVEVIRPDEQKLVAEMRVVETEWEAEIAYLVSLRDITERKEVEEERQKSEKLYRTLASHLPNGAVFLFDENLRYTLAEGTDLQAIGISKELMEGKTIWEVLPPETSAMIEPIYRAALAGKTTVFEWRSGAYIYDTHVLPVRNERNEIFAGMMMTQNITQRKQTEEALRKSEATLTEKATKLKEALSELQRTHKQLVQSEKMSSLGLLIAGVAHEINNPVNFINGNLDHVNEYTQELLELCQLYQQHYPNPSLEIQEKTAASDLDFIIEDLPKMLSSMKLGVERICEIVLSLRKFSRIDDAEMKPVNLHEGMEGTLLILQNRLKFPGSNSSIQLVKEYGAIPEVECYASSINQVFMNIINNGIDALIEYNQVSSRNGIVTNPSLIRISTKVIDEDYVAIEIADNGPGMPAEVKERIFDPFFTTKPVGKGTGLGLSISYQIVVEKHGGELKCYSEMGQGTQFLIKIPIRQSNQSKAKRAEESGR